MGADEDNTEPITPMCNFVPSVAICNGGGSFWIDGSWEFMGVRWLSTVTTGYKHLQ
jgi:hypothetical protein